MAYPLEDLLDWLAEESRIFSWDMIVALNRDKLNQMLSQLYISRFDGDGFSKPFTAPIEVEGNKRFLQDFILDVPRLSFPDVNADQPRAQLALSVISGNDVVVRTGPESRYVERLEWIQPIEGPLLTVDINLAKAGGAIEGEETLLLNLAQSEEKDFNLEFDLDPTIQRLGGAYFFALFKQLPEAEKVFSLGKIKGHENEMFRPRSFTLIPQADKGSATGDGAILAFVSMQAGHEGTQPPNSDKVFRYMIPAPAEDYSAAVMFNTTRIMTAWFVESLREVLACHAPPEYLYRDRVLVGAKMPDAKMELPEDTVLLEFEFAGVPRPYQVRFDPSTIFSSDPKGVELKVDSNTAVISWPLSADLFYEVELLEEGAGLLEKIAEKKLFKVVGTFECEILLNNDRQPKFEVVNSRFIPALAEGAQALEGGAAEAEKMMQALQALYPASQSKGFWDELTRMLFLIYLAGVGFSLVVSAAIIGLILQRIVGALKRVSAIDVGKDLNELIQQLVELNLGGMIVDGSLHAPNDLVRYGKVAALGNAPALSPGETRVALGDHCQFTLEGASSGITWSIEPLATGVAKVGSISATGLYSVPVNAQFTGHFMRERVKATRGGKVSYALVTLARDSLAVAPLLQIVRAGNKAQFSAGSARPGATYNWKISGEAPGATLNRPDGRKVEFTAGPGNHDLPLLAMVEVTAGDVTRGGNVILLPKDDEKSLTIIVEPTGSGSNVMTLRLVDPLFPGDKAVWTVAQGQLSANVTADSVVPQLAYVESFENPVDRLLVICVEVRDEKSNELFARGYSVLPLPFSEYKTVYQYLKNGA